MSVPVRLIQVYAVPYAYAPNGEPLYVEYSSSSLSSSRKRRAPDSSMAISIANDNSNNNFNNNNNPKRKSRLVWTHSLHQSFLNAVHTLGVDIAVPKQIMKIMNVHSLTRENVASHLQKYRAALKRNQQRNTRTNTNKTANAVSGKIANNNTINTQQIGGDANNNNDTKVAEIHQPSLKISKFPLHLVLNNNDNNNNINSNPRHLVPPIPNTHPTSSSLAYLAPTKTVPFPPAKTSSLSTSTTSIRTTSLPLTPPPPPERPVPVRPAISLSTSIRPTSSLPIPPPPISISTNLSPPRTIRRNSSQSVTAPSIRTLPIPPPPVSVSSLHTPPRPPTTITSSLPPIRTLAFQSPV